jgi:predicted Zn-dependent protease
MGAGRFDDAARIYQDMLRTLPNEPGLLMNLGMALALGGHEAEAVAPLERALKLKPGLIPAQLFLGSSYLALGKAEKAVPALEVAVAARPADIEQRRLLAQAYGALGRDVDALAQLRKITEVAPTLPAGWYALGQAYNGLTQKSLATFDPEAAGSPWPQLLLADAYFGDGRLTDAFALYRLTIDRLPSMVSIRDSIAQIYEKTGHPDWAVRERAQGVLPAAACTRRRALCEFRAGRYRAALVAALAGNDAESRYWRTRAAAELARAAFAQVESLPDSRERREVRATFARSERRFADAIVELKAALKFTPGDPSLLDDLGTSYYGARDYAQAVATLLPLLKVNPNDPRILTVCGDSLVQLQRLDEAIPLLQRAVARDAADPLPRQALARAYVQKGDFAAAIPLIELDLAGDQDGSLHMQLARAYTGIGQRDKSVALLERAQDIQRKSQERSAAIAQRAISPPK